MSTQNRFTIVGLVAPGLIWLATSVAQGQETPRPPGQPTTPAPASPSTFSVLLMSNGSVVPGEIIDDPAGGVYRLKTRGGLVPYPKSTVRRAGRSLEELYRYQVAALPPGDHEERMKLVKWCLAQHLNEQAREQLTDLLQRCPDDFEANRMAKNLITEAEAGSRDTELQRTGGEMVAADAPESLPPELVKKLRQGFGNNLPEIFDLSPTLAVRRAAEFAEVIQPVLQQNCASCHNEKYPGEFKLVQVKNIKDLRNPDVARANLDATLQLVDPTDPKRSQLLSAGLVPHGPRKGAVFRGSNDRQYQKLFTWVKSLQSTRPAPDNDGGVTRAGYVPAEATDGFASERSGRSPGATPNEANDDPAAPIRRLGPRPVIDNYEGSADFSKGKATNFPVPFVVGGAEANPTLVPATRVTPRRTPAGDPLAASKPQPVKRTTPVVNQDPEEAADGPTVDPTTAEVVGPGAVKVDMSSHPGDLPGMNQPKYPSSQAAPRPKPNPEAGDAPPGPAGTKPASTSTPKKPKIDPALLDQMIKARAKTP